MAHDPAAEWQVDPVDYPAQGSDADRLRFLLRYAILAPSGHNTQPWLFRLRGDRVELLADRTRALPVVDPHDRALLISCGAALGVLRAAMRHFGQAGAIELLPDGDDPDVLARVGLGALHAPSPTEEARFEAITRRRTTRRAFLDEPLPPGLAEELTALARAEGVELAVIADPATKARLAALVAEGDRAQFADPRFRRELGAWVHSRRAASRDGISGAAFGMPDVLSAAGGLVIRTFDMGEGIAANDQEIAAGSPALLLVATPEDGPRDWLLAGMAHMEALLAVTAAGWTAAYLNQPIEVDALRPRLRETAGVAGHPQLLLRIGRGPEISPAVRRPVEEVLIDLPPRVSERVLMSVEVTMKRSFRTTMGLGAALLGATPALAQDLLVTDVQVVDVAAGTVAPAQDVLVRDGAIAAMGQGLAIPEGAAVFDAAGAFAIPGLWDAHVHVFSSLMEADTAFDMYLLNGVTGIRDMGGLLPLEEQRRIAAEVEDGARRGPRVIPSGAWVDAPPGSWPGMYLAATPEEARARVREIAALGWPAVKSYSMLAPDTYRALAAEAEAIGLPLVGHVPETVTLADAIAAGQDGIEHWGRVTMACSTAEAELVAAVVAALDSPDPRSALIAAMQGHNAAVLETWDEALCRETVGAMAEAGLAVSPTLVVADFYVGERPGPEALRMRVLPPEVRAAWDQPDFRLEAMTDEIRAIADQSIALDHRTFLMAHEARVPILASTDASYANPFIFHGFSLLDELDRYVAIGLSPQEALYTATVAPPVFLGLTDQDGTLAPGRRADLVLLSENPLDGLDTLREPVAVIAKGRLMNRGALDAMTGALLEAGR